MRRPSPWVLATAGGALLVLGLALQGLLASSTTAPATAPAGRFPAPHPHRTATVWAVGDGADGSSSGKRVARLVAGGRPTRFLYLGDVYGSGTADEFRRHYAPVFGRLRGITAPTPGNHDWPLHTEGYDRYWQSVTGRRPPDHYSLRLAGWQLLSLNSEGPLGRGSAHQRWLRRQLARPGNCRIAFWHRPRFSAGSHGDQADVEPLWSAMRGKVRLVVNGHDHNMQEMRPRAGVTGLIAGSGGRGHYPLNAGDRRLAWANATDYGALRLKLRAGRASWAFVAADGRALHRGAVGCRK